MGKALRMLRVGIYFQDKANGLCRWKDGGGREAASSTASSDLTYPGERRWPVLIWEILRAAKMIGKR